MCHGHLIFFLMLMPMISLDGRELSTMVAKEGVKPQFVAMEIIARSARPYSRLRSIHPTLFPAKVDFRMGIAELHSNSI